MAVLPLPPPLPRRHRHSGSGAAAADFYKNHRGASAARWEFNSTVAAAVRWRLIILNNILKIYEFLQNFNVDKHNTSKLDEF